MFAEWKEHPVTKEIFKELTEKKNALQEDIGEGLTLAHRADVTHGLTYKAVGQIAGLNQLLNITYEDASPEEEVDEVTGH